MDPDLYLDVPAGFDDSDADSQVHPMARLLFPARTNAEAFEKARRWVDEHKVFVVDVAWDHASDEPEPITLTLYFRFDDEDGTDEE